MPGADVRPYLPVPEGIIHYYDQFCRAENKRRTASELDAAGRLVIEPSSAVEHYTDARNNTDVIAGLTAVTDGLLALPDDVLPPRARHSTASSAPRSRPFPGGPCGAISCWRRRKSGAVCPTHTSFP